MTTSELHAHFVVVLVHDVGVHNGDINDMEHHATICDHAFAKYNIHRVDLAHQFHACALGNVLTLG